MTLVQAILMILTAASGTAAVLTHEPLKHTIALGFHGMMLALLLLALRAPDVALAQFVVGAVAVPLMFLAAIANARNWRRREVEEGEAGGTMRGGSRE
jgi:energy-converting hydrogenase B subunit D